MRFEVAAYKNKVMNWRNRVEVDIDEVLQTDSVFANVSRGILAKNKDMQKAFGTTDQDAIARQILDKGELQVSDKERQAVQESLYRDVATIVATMCINPETNHPYPFSVIERAMKTMHFSPAPNRNAKQNALQAIKQLKEHIPIERAKMKIRVTVPSKQGKPIKAVLEQCGAQILEESWGAEAKIMALVEPGSYRKIQDEVQNSTRGKGSVDVVELNAVQEIEDVVADSTDNEEQKTSSAATETAPVVTPPPAPKKVQGLACSVCGGDFGTDKQKHRAHYKSDWHRFNLKLKGRNEPVVDEDTFNKIDTEQLEEFFDQLTM